MRVLFTADWHIKLGQKNVPIDWQYNRYLKLVNELNFFIDDNGIDLLIIGGDIFDRVPTINELELYFDIISKLNHRVDIVIYSGNHEAVKKNTTFLSSLKSITSTINSRCIIIDDYYHVNNMDFIPYNKLKEFNPNNFSGNILFTHVRGEIPPHVTPEIDLSLLKRWELVVAGDLHSHSNSQLNIVYPGSPLTTSFHRSEVTNGIVILDSDTLEWEFKSLNLPQLLRKTISNKEEMIATYYHHTIYEIEGNIGELKDVELGALLDKKIIKRAHTSSLQLGSNMSIREELRLYLEEILKIKDSEVVLKEADDYIKNLNLE